MKTVFLNISMLPAKWIRQTDPFRLTQISPAQRNGTRDEHKHLDRVYEKQICSCFLKAHLISVSPF